MYPYKNNCLYVCRASCMYDYILRYSDCFEHQSTLFTFNSGPFVTSSGLINGVYISYYA